MDRILPTLIGVVIAAVVVIGGFAIYQEITEPDSGTVTAKSYHAAYWTTYCHLVGKVTVCTPQHHPECYEVDYADPSGNKGDTCVPAAEYDRYEIGSTYPGGAR